MPIVETIQTAVGIILSKAGVLTNKTDIEEEKARLEKERILREKSKQSMSKYGMGVGIALVVVLGIWFVTKKKK